MGVLSILNEKRMELEKPFNKKKGKFAKPSNRIQGYLDAIDSDSVDEYHRRLRRYYGLKKCPICWGSRKLYIIKKMDEEVVFAQCLKCHFLYNPYDMPLMKPGTCRTFHRDDTRLHMNTSPNYKIVD